MTVYDDYCATGGDLLHGLHHSEFRSESLEWGNLLRVVVADESLGHFVLTSLQLYYPPSNIAKFLNSPSRILFSVKIMKVLLKGIV
jgi:hypothetical protein